MFVCNSWCQSILHCNCSCEIVGSSHVFIKVSRCFRWQCGIRFVKVFRKPLAAFWKKTRDLHLKFGLPTYNPTHSTIPGSCQRLTKDFYKANTALPMKMPTDFDKYVTAAYYFTRTITVTNLLTPTITNIMTTLNYT